MKFKYILYIQEIDPARRMPHRPFPKYLVKGEDYHSEYFCIEGEEMVDCFTIAKFGFSWKLLKHEEENSSTSESHSEMQEQNNAEHKETFHKNKKKSRNQQNNVCNIDLTKNNFWNIAQDDLLFIFDKETLIPFVPIMLYHHAYQYVEKIGDKDYFKKISQLMLKALDDKYFKGRMFEMLLKILEFVYNVKNTYSGYKLFTIYSYSKDQQIRLSIIDFLIYALGRSPNLLKNFSPQDFGAFRYLCTIFYTHYHEKTIFGPSIQSAFENFAEISMKCILSFFSKNYFPEQYKNLKNGIYKYNCNEGEKLIINQMYNKYILHKDLDLHYISHFDFDISNQ